MTLLLERAHFDAAVAKCLEAARAYYHDDKLLMSDDEYDYLINRIAATIDVNPDWGAAGLLDAVAAGTSGAGGVAHATPMLSLAKATDPDELAAFLKRIGTAKTVTEVKLDGLAVAVRYEHGRMVQAATRGDGQVGEDVTAQLGDVTGLPIEITGFTGELRGEVFMTHEDFEASNELRTASGAPAFKNTRNAVSGSLRKAGTQSRMSFACYDVLGDSVAEIGTHRERMALMVAVGVQTAMSLITVDATGDPEAVINAIEKLRPTLPFDIDGAVVKVDSFADRDRLGAGSRSPRWALAWKYPAQEVYSVLRDIEVTVGRTGRIAFTGIIDPVTVAGATVSKATLHNYAFIKANRLGIGSEVLVSRANDVIPRIVGLDTEANARIPIYYPSTDCPQCGDPLDTSEVMWRCHSPECSLVGWVAYFSSRDVMDIDGLGESIVVALVNAGLVADVADLYGLTVADLATLELAEGRELGEKTAVKIHANIAKSKSQPFNRVVTGLGIRMTGRSISRWLASEFHTMGALRAATVEQVATIEKMGPAKARSVVDGLAARADVIDRLAAAGVNMGAEPTADAGGLPLAGMTVVVTGAMSGPLAGLNRTQVQELIEANGGKASGSVSAKTGLLVCGEPGSSKYVKAESLGVRIVTPDEFAAMVGR